MDCEQAMTLISARLDHEIEGDDLALLSSHLRGCGSCRTLAEAWQVQDHELRKAFLGCQLAGAKVTESVLDRFRAEAGVHTVPASALQVRPKLRLPRSSWLWAVAALLPLFAIGLSIYFFRPSRSMPIAKAPGIQNAADEGNEPANLSLALPLKDRLVALACPTREQQESSLPDSTTISTAQGERRRLTLADKSILYVNENTSLHLTGRRQLQLASGEIYVEVAPPEPGGKRTPFLVSTHDRKFTAMGTKFRVQAKGEQSQLLVAQSRVRASSLAAPLADRKSVV